MYIGWDTIIKAGAVLSALALIIGLLIKCYNWYLEQKKQGEAIDELKKQHSEDVRQLRQEFRIVICGLSACLDGLIQQGCNHDVPKAKKMIDDYLNQQAHE